MRAEIGIPALHRRAYLYITRRHEGKLELAVFRHPDHDALELSIQVPRGGIDLLEEVVSSLSTADAGSARVKHGR
jgi:hypothetical protein